MSTACPARPSVESRSVVRSEAAPRAIPAAQFDLPADVLLPIDPRPGLTIRALHGEVWVTQSGRADDIVLTKGQSHTPAQRGRVVIQALSDSRITITGILAQL